MAPGSRTPTGAIPDLLRRRSPRLLRWFSRYAARYTARRLHAVRVARGGRPGTPPGPLIVLLNHASWWDPLVGLVLTGLFEERRHFAPMDAEALGRYRFFERLGFFPVERGTRRGAAEFLRRSREVLGLADGVLWVTGQGRFADPRERPARLRPGTARLAARLERGAVIPLALEYPFWEERAPEALARFGRPIPLPASAGDEASLCALLERRLEETQDELRDAACRRDPAEFETVLSGTAGVGGPYDAWRAIGAWLRGERFRAEHGRTDLDGPAETGR